MIARTSILWVSVMLMVSLLAMWPAGLRVSGQATSSGEQETGGGVLFVENAGQWPAEARFQVWGGAGTLWLARDALWLTIIGPSAETRPTAPDADAFEPWEVGQPTQLGTGVNLRLSFVGTSPAAQFVAANPVTTTVSYFFGSDPAKWRPAVPVWGEVRYANLYPGIDLVLKGEGERWTWRLVGEPSSLPDDGAVLRFEGADGMTLDGANLHLATAAGEVVLPLPAAAFVYQIELVQLDNSIETLVVPASMALNARTIVQTPADDPGDLLYSTFLGGIEGDGGRSVAVDGAGNVYVTGNTHSADFPTTPGAFDPSFNGGDGDAFVVRLTPSGTALAYATFLGGRAPDDGASLAVDNAGRATVMGTTYSDNFPTTPNSFDPSFNGYKDAYVVRLNSTGSALQYGTYLGGSAGDDYGRDVVVDVAGRTTVTGGTSSPNFPTTPGSFDPTYNGGYYGDAFVARLNSAGSALEYATFLGGSGTDHGIGIAVDSAGGALVTGNTASSNFPTTPGAFDPAYNGNNDVFVVRLNAIGSSLAYATYLGGSEYEANFLDIAVDRAGRAAVTGETRSSDFPTTPGAFDPTYNGGIYGDAFVVRLNATGSTLEYATFIGGNATDEGNGVAVDDSGRATVIGTTESIDLPTTPGAFDSSHNGATDAFVVRLNATGTILEYGTFLGGSNDEISYGNAVDAAGHVIATGYAFSNDFPTTPGALDPSFNGSGDAFVSKLDLAPYVPNVRLVVQQPAAGSIVTGTVALSGYAIDLASSVGTGVDRVHLYLDGPAGTGTFLGHATYGLERPGVAAQYGERFRNSGWALDWDTDAAVPGLHWFYVYARRTTDSAWSAPRAHVLTKDGGQSTWLPLVQH